MAQRFGCLRASTPVSFGAPSVRMKAPTGAAVFGDASETVDSTRAASHWRDSELHTTARVLTIADQNSP
jgi:hypothetical protein